MESVKTPGSTSKFTKERKWAVGAGALVGVALIAWGVVLNRRWEGMSDFESEKKDVRATAITFMVVGSVILVLDAIAFLYYGGNPWAIVAVDAALRLPSAVASLFGG